MIIPFIAVFHFRMKPPTILRTGVQHYFPGNLVDSECQSWLGLPMGANDLFDVNIPFLSVKISPVLVNFTYLIALSVFLLVGFCFMPDLRWYPSFLGVTNHCVKAIKFLLFRVPKLCWPFSQKSWGMSKD